MNTNGASRNTRAKKIAIASRSSITRSPVPDSGSRLSVFWSKSRSTSPKRAKCQKKGPSSEIGRTSKRYDE